MGFKEIFTKEGNSNERFGDNVKMYKNTIVVFSSTNRIVSFWENNSKIKEIEGSSTFGDSFDIYENVIVISERNTNRVYFYEKGKNNTEWELFQTVGNIPNITNFGISVSVYGNICLVGSRQKMFVYQKKNNWELQQTIIVENSTFVFGHGACVYKNFLCFSDLNANSTSGEVYLYEYKENKWEYNYTFSDPVPNFSFGTPSSLYENLFISSDGIGKISVFKKNINNQWDIILSDYSDGLENSVSIYKNIVIYGTYRIDDTPEFVKIHKLNENGNLELFQIIESEINQSGFGKSTSIYQNQIIVGAYEFNSNAGKIYVYNL